MTAAERLLFRISRTVLEAVGKYAGVLILLAFASYGCSGGGGGGGKAPTPGPANLVSIVVTPADPSIAQGTNVQLIATGQLSNGTSVDLTSGVNWRSSASDIISVSTSGSTKGQALAVGVGQAVVTASLGGINGSTTVTGTQATLVAIAVSPSNPKIPSGTDIQLTATGVFSNGTSQDLTTSVTWSSSSAAIASVQGGLVTANATGEADITAALGGISGSTTVTVTSASLQAISVSPPQSTIASNTSVRLTATGQFSDGTTLDVTSLVNWSSSTSTTAHVSNVAPAKGQVTGLSPGMATISAAALNVSGAGSVTVTASTLQTITVVPADPSIPAGTTTQLSAIGTFSDGSSQDITANVSWSSSATPTAIVAKGLVTGVAAGTATIQAVQGSVQGSTTVTVTAARLTSITVTPSNPSLAQGLNLQLIATGTFSDGSTLDLTSAVSWASSAGNIAQVSNSSGSQGVVTALSQGSATIGATLNGLSGSTTVTVTAATLTSISVTPAESTIANGTTVQLTATGTFSDGTTGDLTNAVTWTSGANQTASVSSSGLVTGNGVGSTSITAAQGSVSGSASVTVNAVTLTSIVVTPASASIPKGTTAQLTATGQYSDGSTQDLTGTVNWTTSAASVATVSNASGTQGLVTGIATGSANITATSGSITGSSAITVTAATLSSIAVSPATTTVAAGVSMRLTATGTYSDGSTSDVTSSATWTSSDPSIVTVGNTTGRRGRITGQSPGSATVTAAVGSISGASSVTVTSATLTTITITPVSPSIAKGTLLQMTATGTYSNGTTQDLTTSVTWTTSNATVAQISNATGSQGQVDALGRGNATISAALPQSSISGSTLVTVTAATLSSIAVTPAAPSIAVGTMVQLTATATFSDGSTLDVTSAADWSTSSSGVAVVSNTAGSQGLVTGVGPGSATIGANLQGVTGSATVTVAATTLVSIDVTPAQVSIANGTTVQLTATGTFSDGSTSDITSSVSWSSGASQIATVNASGLVTGTGLGSATISAMQSGVTGSAAVTVTAATLTSIVITPEGPSIAKGTTVQLTATGQYSDGSTQDLTTTVTWSSDAAAVATVSNAAGTQGLVTGVGSGTANITAASGTVSDTTPVTVTSATLSTIAVFPPTPTVASGVSAQLTAIGTYTDGSTLNLTSSVTWSSSNPAQVTVSNASGHQGRITGHNPGSATVSAGLGGISGSASVTVTSAVLNSITLTPANPSIAKGTTVQMTATGNYSNGSTQDLTTSVTWSSSSTSIAAVSNAAGSQGLVSGLMAGSASITAALPQSSVTGTTTVTVTGATLTSIAVEPAAPSIAVGATVQLAAIGTFSDGSTRDVTSSADWSTTADTVAVVSNAVGTHGLVTGVGAGSATIGANLNGVTGTAAVTVAAATLTSISVTPVESTIANGSTVQLTATGIYSDGTTADLTSEATWMSADTQVAQVNTSGLVAGASVGSTSISATKGNISGSATVNVTTARLTSITVTPVETTIANGTTLQMTATGIFSDGTTADITNAVTWRSASAQIASVNSSGLVTGRGVGTTSISATQGAVSGAATVTVDAATLTSIVITPVAPTIAKGTTVQLTATGQFSDGSTQDLTTAVNWSSSASSIATVSNATGTQGLVTGVSSGSATLTAAKGMISGSTTVTVTSATLTSIKIFPSLTTIASGVSGQLSAIGTLSDGTTINLTSAATWSSSNRAFVTVSNAIGHQGMIFGRMPGEATITAMLGSLSDTAQVFVTSAALSSITVTPVDPAIAKGATLQMTATGNYSDGTTEDLTDSVTWVSSTPTVAEVSNASDSQGLVDALAPGTSTISASLPQSGVTGSTTLTVTAATLTSIAVEPSTPSVAAGTTVQMTATASFSDGTTLDVTSSAHWTTSNGAVAVVSNSPDSEGLVTGVAVGNAAIGAELNGVIGATTVTVTAATLVSITITPVDPSLGAGTTLQLTATGVYSDSTTADLTGLASWTSSDDGVATVDETGLLDGVAAGSATITARFEGVSTSTDVTVTGAVLTEIIVEPTNASLPPLASLQMTATGIFSDGSTQDLTQSASWSSDQPLTAWVSNRRHRQGRVTAIIPGTADIFAVYNGLAGSATVSVSILSSLTITPANPTIAVHQIKRLHAIGALTGTDFTIDLTDFSSWNSADSSVASVGNFLFKGRLLGHSQGTTTITAAFLPGLSDSTTATVTGATLRSITLSPANPKIAAGSSVAMTATGNYSDGSTEDLTEQATWTSSDQSVARVSNAGGSQGEVTGKSAGKATITATYAGLSGATRVTVTSPRLVSIHVTPKNVKLRVGEIVQMKATGSYSDGSSQDLTDFADWTSDNERIAEFDYCHHHHRGELRGRSRGTTNVHAEYRGVVGTTSAKVR